jgi:hypothetical protein
MLSISPSIRLAVFSGRSIDEIPKQRNWKKPRNPLCSFLAVADGNPC